MFCVSWFWDPLDRLELQRAKNNAELATGITIKNSEVSALKGNRIEKETITTIARKRSSFILSGALPVNGFRATIQPSKNSHTLACGAKYVRVPIEEIFENGSIFIVNENEKRITNAMTRFWFFFELFRFVSHIKKKNSSG